MLMPEKVTATSRPNLHVLAISAVFNFCFWGCIHFSFFFCYLFLLLFFLDARSMICDELLIFENSVAWLHWNLTGDTN